jgi:hypothetical protein
MSGDVLSLPQYASWRGAQLKAQGQLYFTLTLKPACIGKVRNAYEISVGKPDAKTSFRRLRRG